MNFVECEIEEIIIPEDKKLSELKPRKFRFGRYKRGKNKRLESRNLSKLPYFKNPVLPKNGEPIGLDIECVRDRMTNKLLPGWIALSVYSPSNKIEGCVLQSKIYHDESRVDRMERFSGITRKMLREGQPYEQIKPQIIFFLENYLIVGAGIDKDLEILGLSNFTDRCVDIQSDFRDRNDQPIDLKELTFALLKKRIQSFDEKRPKGHNPIIDSRMTVKLYKRRKEGKIDSESDEETETHSFEFCRKVVTQDQKLNQILIEEKLRKREQKIKVKRNVNKDKKAGKTPLDWPVYDMKNK